MVERKGGKFLLSSLALATGFGALVSYVFLAKAGLLYFLWVLPFAYICTAVLLFGFVAGAPRPLVAASSIVLGALAIVAVTSVLASSHGYPAQYQTSFTSCSNVQTPNATSPWGYTDSSRCSTSPVDSAVALLWNFGYWLPVSGLVVYVLPSVRRGESTSERAGHAVVGLILLVALLLPLVGIPSVGS